MSNGHNRQSQQQFRNQSQQQETSNVLSDFKSQIEQSTTKFTDSVVLDMADSLGEFFAKQEEIKNTQFRKFFNQVKMLKTEDDVNKLRIKLKIIQAQLAYTVKRPGKLMTENFKKFIDVCFGEVILKTKSYQDFCKFFEAVYAYFYFHCPPKNRQ